MPPAVDCLVTELDEMFLLSSNVRDGCRLSIEKSNGHRKSNHHQDIDLILMRLAEPLGRRVRERVLKPGIDRVAHPLYHEHV